MILPANARTTNGMAKILRKLMKHLPAASLLVLLMPSLVMAQDDGDWQNWTLGSPFALSLDLFHASLDTSLRVDATDGTPGTRIDFEQNLGMSDTESLPIVNLGWRLAKKHRLTLGYYAIKRSGSAITADNIRIGDFEFDLNVPIASFLDLEIASASYSYSLLFNEKRELAVSAGLSLVDIQWGFSGDGVTGPIDTRFKLDVPVPSIGVSGSYAFGDKFFLQGNVGHISFDLALSDEVGLRGHVTTAAAGLYHRTFDQVRLGLAYLYFDFNIDWGSPSGFNALQYTYQGPSLNVTMTF